MKPKMPITLRRVQIASLIGGSICLALCALGYGRDPRQFYASYLFAYVFWLGLALGCLGVNMIHQLSGGQWGFVTRRLLEAGFMTLPMMAVLFLPIGLGLRELYPWASPEAVAASPRLVHQLAYLNPTGFGIRALICFGLWIAMAVWLRQGSLLQDTTASPAPTIRMRALSGPGLVLYPLTATFAFIDWVMSLEPEWHSTIFLVIIMIGQILSALAWVTLLLSWLRQEPSFSQVLAPAHFHDLGNLLLAFVVFWTYVSFGQLLIIYSGNLPAEISWYLHRIAGGWKFVVLALAAFHFLVPFFLLLFRGLKRKAEWLARCALLILGVHAVAVYWLIAPTFHPSGLEPNWRDAAAWLGIGGLWIACYLMILARQPLLPQNDPRIDYSIAALAHDR
jgi:hypothetical protein